MINELRFVQGAVSKKDFLPALTHFRIQNGTVRSYNGMMALCSPIALDLDVTPKAEPLVKAINNCDETVSLTITPTGRLSVKSGSFRALIDCVQEETPHVLPEGDRVEFDGVHFLAAMKAVYPFIGTDASRQWGNGVLLLNQSAFATNNVCLIEYWVGCNFPISCNIPRVAVKEILRIDEAPTHAQMTETSITFHYTGDRWLRTQLFSTDWPDIGKILSAEANLTTIDTRLFEAVEKLKPFTDKMGRIFINKGIISTTQDPEQGAHYFVPDMQSEGIYNVDMLQLLQGVVTTIDMTTYPKPCMFQGDRLRGAIVGMKPI